MELLDRYLQAVRFWLPKAQQNDIIAELGDDLRSQIEEKESALSRPLTEDELVALLQQSGHPMRVATRYQPQQSLIGPGLFPLYKFVLKIVTFCYLVPWLLVAGGLMIFWPSYRAAHTGLGAVGIWASFWNLAFTIYGIVTLVFAVLERYKARVNWANKWDPRKLPAVAKPKDKSRVPRIESIFELVFSILFILGWLSLPGIAHSMFAQANNTLVAVPELAIYFWLFLIPTVLSMAQQFINLFRPQWTWLRPPARLLSTAITFWLVESLLRINPHYVLASGLAGDAKDAARYANLASAVNQISQWSLICFAIGLGIALIVFGYQTVQIIRNHKGGAQGRTGVQISQVL